LSTWSGGDTHHGPVLEHFTTDGTSSHLRLIKTQWNGSQVEDIPRKF
jgi:hypothetical protein